MLDERTLPDQGMRTLHDDQGMQGMPDERTLHDQGMPDQGMIDERTLMRGHSLIRG